MEHIANVFKTTLLNIVEASDDPDHGLFLTTAVGSVLDDSGTNYDEMECAGDEFDIDN